MDALAVPFLVVVLPFAVCGVIMAGFIAWWLAVDFVRRAWR
jgi:hypothetical protein